VFESQRMSSLLWNDLPSCRELDRVRLNRVRYSAMDQSPRGLLKSGANVHVRHLKRRREIHTRQAAIEKLHFSSCWVWVRIDSA
jgi:hypothetical protein